MKSKTSKNKNGIKSKKSASVKKSKSKIKFSKPILQVKLFEELVQEQELTAHAYFSVTDY